MEALADGKRIYVAHFRRFKTPEGKILKGLMSKWEALEEDPNLVPLPTGGGTFAVIYDEWHNELSRAEATCSKKDHYNKKIGRNIAIGRAMKKLTEV